MECCVEITELFFEFPRPPQPVAPAPQPGDAVLLGAVGCSAPVRSAVRVRRHSSPEMLPSKSLRRSRAVDAVERLVDSLHDVELGRFL